MDAFFAACEERYNPELRGRPIVIGADPKGGRGRGVVSTANYKAREFGIHSAMPISQAWRLAEAACRRGAPATVFLRGNHELYQEVSDRIMKMLKRSADAFEQSSIDEAYLESKFQIDPWREAERFAKELSRRIFEQEGLTCSVGIGPNKLVAKIASGFRKPDGLTVVRPGDVHRFLDPLSIRVIPGVGPKSEAFLHARGIRTIGDLRKLTEAELVEAFSKWGHDLYRKARGIDDLPVTSEWVTKSIGEQETFERDTRSASFLTDRLYAMAERVVERVKAAGFKGFRTVTLVVRFHDFETKSRSRTLAEAVLLSPGRPGRVSPAAGALERLTQEALRLLIPFFDARENPKRKLIRLIGLRVEKLVSLEVEPR